MYKPLVVAVVTLIAFLAGCDRKSGESDPWTGVPIVVYVGSNGKEIEDSVAVGETVYARIRVPTREDETVQVMLEHLPDGIVSSEYLADVTGTDTRIPVETLRSGALQTWGKTADTGKRSLEPGRLTIE